MTFKDIFKNSFLNGFSSGIDVKTILIGLAITTVLSLYIFFIYRLVTRKTFYAQTFNLSLIAMAVITAAIILTIQSNIVLSLGMVGALSIIRFRTAIKDPLDLVFLYWSISIGIICGAGLSVIAVILTLLISLVVLGMQKYPLKKLSMILVVNSTDIDSDTAILETVAKYSENYKVKSKNLTPSSLDMVIEIKVDAESRLVREVLNIEGVTSASILSHDGEITV
ncbi:MAG: DUF4956 domain-containing protein [Clostridia bacterium]|nr:DUF4956 domain-containing protein [Clostridia bacterium]